MTEQHELSHAESLVEVDSQVLNDIDQGPNVDGRQQELEERNAFRGEAVVRLMVTLSLNLARVLLHTPADTILTRAAENPILPESVRESAASLASQESVDFAAIAQRIIAASTDMLKPKDVSTPELEMTSEAFSALLRLATQFMGHINGLDAEQVYESSKSYMVLQRSAPTQNQRRVSLTRMVRNRIMPQHVPIDAFRRYTRFAMAAYGALGMKYLGVLPRANTSLWNNNQAIQYLTGVDPERSLLGAEWRAKWSGSVYRPGWFVALDHNHKEVVVAIRGSFRFQDSLTDLMCEDAPFSFHYDKTQDLENAQREIQEVINSVEGALFGLNSNLEDMTIGELESDVIDTTQNLFSNLKGFLHRQSVLVREEMDIVMEEERYLDSDDSEQGFDSEEENAREERQSLLQWVKQMNSSSAASSGAEGRRKLSLPRPKMLSGRETRDEQAPKGFRKVKGRAHFGFLKAARALAIELEQVVLRGLEAHPAYKVVLVGHSLGSAVATLITLLWSKHTKLKSARCYGLAPPACLSKEIAESPIACSKITSLVLEDDLVPRLSLGSVSDLRDSIRFVSTRKVSSDAHGRTVCEFVKSVVSQDLPEQTKSAAFTPVMNKIRATSHAHEKLYPAGTIYHLENGKADLSLARKKKPTDFGEIILSSSMFLSHVPDSYVYSICGSLPLPQAEPQMDPSPTMVA